jgi:hypothetical protein
LDGSLCSPSNSLRWTSRAVQPADAHAQQPNRRVLGREPLAEQVIGRPPQLVDEGQGNLDGILFNGRKRVPKGQWWVYQRYGSLSGRLAATTPSAKIDLVASLDERGKTAQVLLGNAGGLQGNVTVRFQGLDKAGYLQEGGQVHVGVERISEEKGGPVTKVQKVLDTRLPVRDNVLDVVIPWTSDRDALAVRLGVGQR